MTIFTGTYPPRARWGRESNARIKRLQKRPAHVAIVVRAGFRFAHPGYFVRKWLWTARAWQRSDFIAFGASSVARITKMSIGFLVIAPKFFDTGSPRIIVLPSRSPRASPETSQS